MLSAVAHTHEVKRTDTLQHHAKHCTTLQLTTVHCKTLKPANTNHTSSTAPHRSVGHLSIPHLRPLHHKCNNLTTSTGMQQPHYQYWKQCNTLQTLQLSATQCNTHGKHCNTHATTSLPGLEAMQRTANCNSMLHTATLMPHTAPYM